MSETRLQRLEALLSRVRRRSAEARNGAPKQAAAPSPEPVEVDEESSIVTAPPPPAPVSVQPSVPRSLPVQAPDSGWPESPSAPPPAAVAAPGETALLEVVDQGPLETLDEDDLLEIPSDMLESVPPSGGVEAREDEPPASSQRPKAAHLDDLASASAALANDEGREVPLKTPPPESGPQAAPPPAMGAPPPVDVDQLLEADLMPPPVAASAPLPTPFDSLEQPFGSRPPPPASGPTVEQLGQTIELEESRGPELELDRPLASPAEPPPPPDELEASLPGRESDGTYHDSLMPPPQAEQDLEAHRERMGESPAVALPSAMPEVSLGEVPPLATMPAAAGEASSSVSVVPSVASLQELVQRPALSSSDVIQVKSVDQRPSPRTFLQLLDASIDLGG